MKAKFVLRSIAAVVVNLSLAMCRRELFNRSWLHA